MFINITSDFLIKTLYICRWVLLQVTTMIRMSGYSLLSIEEYTVLANSWKESRTSTASRLGLTKFYRSKSWENNPFNGFEGVGNLPPHMKLIEQPTTANSLWLDFKKALGQDITVFPSPFFCLTPCLRVSAWTRETTSNTTLKPGWHYSIKKFSLRWCFRNNSTLESLLEALFKTWKEKEPAALLVAAVFVLAVQDHQCCWKLMSATSSPMAISESEGASTTRKGPLYTTIR